MTSYYLVYEQHPLSSLSLELPSQLEEFPEFGMMEKRLAPIEQLEDYQDTTISQTRVVQAGRKERFDSKIPHEDLVERDLVLLYDS